MTKRERAIQIADDAIEQIENGNIVPDTEQLLGYAIVYALADISERLGEIEEAIGAIYTDGIDVGK